MRLFSENDTEEFAGAMIDILEDFCDNVGIDIANTEKIYDPDMQSHIVGLDYDRLGNIVRQYSEGKIRKENVSLLVLAEFVNILSERGAFPGLYRMLDDTVQKWDKCKIA